MVDLLSGLFFQSLSGYWLKLGQTKRAKQVYVVLRPLNRIYVLIWYVSKMGGFMSVLCFKNGRFYERLHAFKY